MTSKYRYQIEISRPVNEQMLLELLKTLENGSLLQFPEPILRTQLGDGIVDLDIVACGYITVDRNTKIIKLTNSQRREFIKLAQESLVKIRENPKQVLTTIMVLGNEYIDHLEPDDY